VLSVGGVPMAAVSTIGPRLACCSAAVNAIAFPFLKFPRIFVN